MIRADGIFDDSPSVIERCRKASPGMFIGAIEYPYNRHMVGQANCLAKDWSDTAAAWDQLVDSVTRFAEEVVAPGVRVRRSQ